MKWIQIVGASALVMLTLQQNAKAAVSEGSRAFQIHNRIRVEYDDNVFLTDGNQESSYKIIEELEFFLNFNLDQTFLSLRYRPSFVWWDNRPGDETDLNHDFDFVMNHDFSPRLSLSVKDTFRLAELPELIDRGTTLRENNDFEYNTLNGTVAYQFSPETRAELAGRYILLRYDNSDVANREDYDLYAAGLTLRHQAIPETALLGEVRFETISYDGPDRGTDSAQAGGGVEQTFSPNLLGNARAGWQFKQFNVSSIDSANSPYVDGNLTFLPSPATRISAGLGYALYETDVFPFANQERFSASLSLAHDWSARLTWFISTGYLMNQLNADEAIPADLNGDGVIDPPPKDGNETVLQLSTRIAYRLNRSNSLEAGWQLVNLDSDVRDNYTRNRVDVGWKVEL